MLFGDLKFFHQPGGGSNTIQAVKAREIFDSRGNPTVEVDLCTETAAWLGIWGATMGVMCDVQSLDANVKIQQEFNKKSL